MAVEQIHFLSFKGDASKTYRASFTADTEAEAREAARNFVWEWFEGAHALMIRHLTVEDVSKQPDRSPLHRAWFSDVRVTVLDPPRPLSIGTAEIRVPI